jgi:TolB-like protein/DNA-binding winged helix-turn-helix (wHTH) protein/tetratricopeptide (TPR) repeat protein
VEPGLNTVSHSGTTAHLEPKVMQVLVCLAEQPGEPVTKEQLLHTVWPDTFVSDDVLTRSISELRRVFVDDAKDSHFIQTIPKRGYRLIAPVVWVGGVSPATPAKPPLPGQIPESPRQGRIRIFAFVAGAILFLALLARFKVIDIPGWLPARSRPPIQSLAVLPLQNLSGDPSQEYFADAMTEELITELSRISALKVISRTSIMRYKNADKGLPQIAHELGVDGIVEGSVLRSGGRVRVTAQLIYAPKDTNVWVQTYDRDLQDVLTLQATVASSIAEEIRVKMKPDEQAQFHSRRPVNLKAHEAYMQGRYHLQLECDSVFKRNSAKVAAAEAEEAKKYFQLAIQEDPNYAPSYLGIWEVLVASPVPGRDWVPQAKPQLLKALQLDDSLAEAHSAMASLFRFDLDFAGARSEYQRAIQLAPSNPDAHSDYANFLASVEGRPQDAMAEYELAQRLDPKNDRMADAFYYARQFDRAIELYQTQAQSRPGDLGVHISLANIYALTGRHEEAISEWRRAAEILEYNSMSDAIGNAYKSSGYKGALRVFAHILETSTQTSYVPFTFIASIYGFSGDSDQAFVWLNKAYDARDGVDCLQEPLWDSLRSDPRFKDLVQRVGLPQ